MTLTDALAAAKAKGYKAAIVNANGPFGRKPALYLSGAYVNEYVHTDVDGAIPDATIEGLKDQAVYVTPDTAQHHG